MKYCLVYHLASELIASVPFTVSTQTPQDTPLAAFRELAKQPKELSQNLNELHPALVNKVVYIAELRADLICLPRRDHLLIHVCAFLCVMDGMNLDKHSEYCLGPYLYTCHCRQLCDTAGCACFKRLDIQYHSCTAQLSHASFCTFHYLF